MFDQAVFGMIPHERDENNALVLEILYDDNGREVARKRFDIVEIVEKGQGDPPESYMPKSDETRQEFIDVTFNVPAVSYTHLTLPTKRIV